MRFIHQMAVLLSISVPLAPLHAATLEKISASYGAISGSMAPIWVAKEARLFEKHGLDLNLVYISGGPRSISRFWEVASSSSTTQACPLSKPIKDALIRR